MNDPLHGASLRGGHAGHVQMAPAATWPAVTENVEKQVLFHGLLKGRQDLPLYCNPLVIFVLNWILMLISLSFQITYVTYPNMGIPLLLAALSLGSFLFGYLVSRTLLHRWPTRTESLSYTLNVTRLWQASLLCCAAAILIIVFNWVLSGPPPAIGYPSSYLIYGRFKQVLFPLLVVVTVNSLAGLIALAQGTVCVVRDCGNGVVHYPRPADGIAAADAFCLFAEDADEQKRRFIRLRFAAWAWPW